MKPKKKSEKPEVQIASLSEKIAAKRARRIETAPESFRKLLRLAMYGTCSPRQAIKAQCAECVGFDRDAIRTCTAYACPLWSYRPFPKPLQRFPEPKTRQPSDIQTSKKSSKNFSTFPRIQKFIDGSRPGCLNRAITQWYPRYNPHFWWFLDDYGGGWVEIRIPA